MTIFWSDNPVRDAELAAIDRRPVIGTCDICKCEIHGADGIYEADDAFAFEDGGDIVCDNCLYRYCREHFSI